MKYKITHQTKYGYSEAVPVCHNLVHLAPRTLPHQSCDEFRLTIHPDPFEVSHSNDYFGNQVAYFSIDQAHRGLTVTATSQICVAPVPILDASTTSAWETIVEDLHSNCDAKSLAAYQYVFDSQAINPFSELTDYARASFPPSRPVLEGALDLTARIKRDFKFDPRVTTINTPLREVFEKRHGVCQDFAQLQIACLRGLGLAARYVSGYLRTEPPPGKPRLVGADASHAWVSVYCGKDGWIDVDPTNDLLVGTDHVTLAWGRDYHDVCPIQGIIMGGGEHKMSVSVDVEPLAE